MKRNIEHISFGANLEIVPGEGFFLVRVQLTDPQKGRLSLEGKLTEVKHNNDKTDIPSS